MKTKVISIALIGLALACTACGQRKTEIDPCTLGDTAYYNPDADGDGYYPSSIIDAETLAECGMEQIALDCDDTRSDIHPGATEDDCTDPVDYNCDGSTGYADADGDGFAACRECDDANAGANPSMIDQGGDDIDANCDGSDAPSLVALTERYDGSLVLVDVDDRTSTVIATNMSEMIDVAGDGSGGFYVVVYDRDTTDTDTTDGAIYQMVRVDAENGIEFNTELVRDNLSNPTGVWFDVTSRTIYVVETDVNISGDDQISTIDRADGDAFDTLFTYPGLRDVVKIPGNSNVYASVFTGTGNTDGSIVRYDGNNLIEWITNLDTPNGMTPMGPNIVAVASRDGRFLYQVNLSQGQEDTTPMAFSDGLTGTCANPNGGGLQVGSSGYLFSWDFDDETSGTILDTNDLNEVWGCAASLYSDPDQDGAVSLAYGGTDLRDGVAN